VVTATLRGMPAAEERLRLAESVAGGVADPELPMVTLAELGIVRRVFLTGGRVVVEMTPTYTGCPALAEMRHDVTRRLREAGFSDVEVRTVLTPPWSSDWITDGGRRKLAAAGIAPPQPARVRGSGPIPLTLRRRSSVVPCPRCGSSDTVETARFSATACKALLRCRSCDEPFEYLKDI
jgi:ring-1,2-phenylacetyl-CoA epoxidase subunit PaaD